MLKISPFLDKNDNPYLCITKFPYVFLPLKVGLIFNFLNSFTFLPKIDLFVSLMTFFSIFKFNEKFFYNFFIQLIIFKIPSILVDLKINSLTYIGCEPNDYKIGNIILPLEISGV